MGGTTNKLDHPGDGRRASAKPVNLELARRLREDKNARLRYFWAESSRKIAEQLIALRKRRGLTQADVAKLTATKQPAISRVEQADYQNWNLKTLRSIAEALDARVLVVIQPSEDVLNEYEPPGEEQRDRWSKLLGSGP